MTPRLILLTSITLALSAPVSAEIYRQVDAQGNVTYTDEPSGQSPAEPVDVKPTTTITLPKPAAVREPEQLREKVKKEGAAYSDLRFAAPQDQQAFHSGSGDVSFQVTSAPGLKGSHKYEVTLDGQPVGQTSSGTVNVRNIDRGTHQAGVSIVDSSGVTIKPVTPSALPSIDPAFRTDLSQSWSAGACPMLPRPAPCPVPEKSIKLGN